MCGFDNQLFVKRLIFSINNRAVHEDSTHLMEFKALDRFCKVIGPHMFSGTVTKVNFTCFVVLLDEEVLDLDVFSPFQAGCMTVLFGRETTHVVLENDVVRDCVSLGFKEMTSPKDIT